MATETTTTLAGQDQARTLKELNTYDDGYLRIEHDNYYISLAGVTLSIPPKEFLIISRVARKVDRTVTAAELWRHAWGEGVQYNSRSLRVHIYRLRSRFAPRGVGIETMIGVGYRLTAIRRPLVSTTQPDGDPEDPAPSR